MSGNQEEERALTPLEAALAALTPRAERLDRERLMFLAGRASVLGDRGQGATAGLSGSGHDSTAGQASRGTRPPHTRQVRWAWPTAFAAMTAVAAGLLVALVIQSGRHAAPAISVPSDSVAGNGDRQPTTSPRRDEPIGLGPEDQRPGTPPWAADALVLSTADRRLERVLVSELSGVTGGETPGAARAPVSYRELLESLLKDGGS